MPALLLVFAALCAACTGGGDRRKTETDDAPKAAATKDAAMPERHLIVELRWIQIIDRHSRPVPADEPVLTQKDSGALYEDRFVLPDYAARPDAEKPEIRIGEWTLAIPETTPASYELVVDSQSGDRVLLFSRGWKMEAGDKVVPAVVLRSNRELRSADGSSEGPNQVGFAPGRPGQWQATKAIGHHGASSSYYELMEARFVEITDRPAANVERGAPDTVSGQREKEGAWPIEDVTLP